VISSDPDVADAVSAGLRATVYAIRVAHDASAALALLDSTLIDVVLLDLDLTDAAGLALCTELTTRSALAIVCCGSEDRRADGVRALRAGADDFLVKPFDPMELEARIGATLRRTAALRPAKPRCAERDAYCVGQLVVYRAQPRVLLGADELQLAPSHYRLLATLARTPGTPVPQAELIQAVWGPGEADHRRALYQHVCQLRARLAEGPVAPPPIILVRQVGYQLGRDAQDPQAPPA
jgi:DNA-binding response OmpR family regulator